MEFFHLRAGEEFIRLGQVFKKQPDLLRTAGRQKSNTRRICQCKRRS